jgi:hypothetical protein
MFCRTAAAAPTCPSTCEYAVACTRRPNTKVAASRPTSRPRKPRYHSHPTRKPIASSSRNGPKKAMRTSGRTFGSCLRVATNARLMVLRRAPRGRLTFGAFLVLTLEAPLPAAGFDERLNRAMRRG